MGYFGACAGSSTVTSGPGIQVIFDENALYRNATLPCFGIRLSVIDRSWVTATTSKASVSFQFQTKRDTTFVRNEHGVSVGRVLGNGASITIDVPETVKYMQLCVALEIERDARRYPVVDFGTADQALTTITPIEAQNVTITEILGIQFACAFLDYSSFHLTPRPSLFNSSDFSSWRNAIFFPIETVEDPDSFDPDYLDSSTEGLVYTLAALFLLDLVLLTLFLINMSREILKRGTAIPVVAYIAFIFTILCIFRICFMFIYAAGAFDDNPLAEFVVFEIPTFLLFTTVILALGFWQKLVKQKTFFSTSETKLLVMVALAIFLVWTLFAVITIVYAESILTKKEESPCPGRVAPSTDDLDDATRTLFVVYQVGATLCHSYLSVASTSSVLPFMFITQFCFLPCRAL